MKKTESRRRANVLNLIAQNQTFGGKMFQNVVGMVRSRTEQKPFRILDNHSVYHSISNEYDLPEITYNREKVYKWGQFYNPVMTFGTPIGGWNKVYVDSRLQDWYLLWIVSKLDSFDIGSSDWLPSIVSWTQKQEGDTIKRAGYRLFWAAALAMDYIEENGLYNEEEYKDGTWPEWWSCTPSCFHVLASIRKTKYRSEEEYNCTLSNSPNFLRPHLISRKLPGYEKRSASNVITVTRLSLG